MTLLYQHSEQLNKFTIICNHESLYLYKSCCDYGKTVTFLPIEANNKPTKPCNIAP